MTKDWEPLQDEIRQLYHVENRKLTDVMRIIHGRHNFKASERSYRAQMRKWGYMKYSTQDFPKPNRRSQSSKKCLGSSSRGIGAVAASDSSLDTHSLDLRSALSGFSQPNSSGPSYMHNGHSFFPSSMTSQSLVPTEQLHTAWPLNVVSQNGGGGDRRNDLHFAIIREDEQTVRRLLFDGFSVEDEDNTGNQPLHYAVQGTSENIVSLLIRYGSDVNAKGQRGQTPLHLAASKLNFARCLLTAGAITEVQDEHGDTPVHSAVLSLSHNDGPKELRSSVLYAMVERKCDLNIGNLCGKTPFHGLLDQDPLKMVISEAQIHCLRNGASSTLPHPDGRTPLEIVLSHHQRNRSSQQSRYFENLWPLSTIIKVLIDQGADPQTALSSELTLISACFEAVREGEFRRDTKKGQDMCKAICERADIVQDRIPGEDRGVSLLHMLARCCVRTDGYWGFDTIPLFTAVLERGADPNLQDDEGKTPLHLLFTKGNNSHTVFKVMELMIKYGGKPLISDLSGDNPVFAAAEFFASTRSPKCIPSVLVLLKSTLNFPTVDSPDTQGGWGDWNLATGATEWNQALEIIRGSQLPCSTASIKAVKEGAVGALAEWHMKARDGDLKSPDELQQRRKHIAQIIHDCQSMGVPVDIQYYRKLVELSL